VKSRRNEANLREELELSSVWGVQGSTSNFSRLLRREGKLSRDSSLTTVSTIKILKILFFQKAVMTSLAPGPQWKEIILG
jgi:hypothetical protein